MTGISVPEHRDERAHTPRDPARGRPVGRKCRVLSSCVNSVEGVYASYLPTVGPFQHPETDMHAAAYTQPGAPEVLVCRELPDPTCGSHDVVIDVHFVSIEGGDVLSRAAMPVMSDAQ